MTTIELSEKMKALSIRMELLSIEMMDLADDGDLIYQHGMELHGASWKIRSWSIDILTD